MNQKIPTLTKLIAIKDSIMFLLNKLRLLLRYKRKRKIKAAII